MIAIAVEKVRETEDNQPLAHVSGYQEFGERPLAPRVLQGRFLRDYLSSLAGTPDRKAVNDNCLLPDQLQTIRKDIPVTILILGGGGSLASGFLSRGAAELSAYLGKDAQINYVMCDVFPPDSPRANALVEKRLKEGEYKLHETTPYISVEELTKPRLKQLGIDLIIAATPPNVHLDDAVRATMLEIPTYIEKPAYPAGFGCSKRPVIEQVVRSGHVNLIDFFLGNRALIDFLNNPEEYLSGKMISKHFSLGPIEFIHATCLEPHSVREEGARQQLLMTWEVQGGFLYADQAPHPLAVMEATVNKLFGLSLTDSRIAATYRTRETEVSGPQDAETGAAVLRVLDVPSTHSAEAQPQIELLSVVGKGLQIIGGRNESPLSNYMLTIGCSGGRIDISVGDGQNTTPSYLCITPYDDDFRPKLFEYAHSGLGYGIILADFVIAAQARKKNEWGPADTMIRIKRQTNSSLAAMRSIEQVYRCWHRDGEGVQHYGAHEVLHRAELPDQLPLACFVHGSIEQRSSVLGRDLLKQE